MHATDRDMYHRLARFTGHNATRTERCGTYAYRQPFDSARNALPYRLLHFDGIRDVGLQRVEEHRAQGVRAVARQRSYPPFFVGT